MSNPCDRTSKEKDIKVDCFVKKQKKDKPFLLFDDIDGNLEYTKEKFSTNLHIGQRKLFLAELLFLVKCYKYYNDKDEKKLIYIGAAPGNHTYLLTILFPDITFHLYDKKKFNIQETKNVKIFNQFFLEEDVKPIKNCLFVSDIRTENPSEEIIEDDMELQKNIVKKMQPLASLLKFRVNFTPDRPNVFKYLDGDLYVQIYAPINSSELRLMIIKDIHNYEEKKYKIDEVESKCSYFNKIIRKEYYYDHEYSCISHHFDGISEVQVWIDFLNFKKIKHTKELICSLINLLSYTIINYQEFDKILSEKNKILKY
jgi:hypothetical protein